MKSDHIKLLGIPAWYAAMICHTQDKFTMPIGVNVEIGANKGEIRMLEPAVAKITVRNGYELLP